jgi:hypothetical protein
MFTMDFLSVSFICLFLKCSLFSNWFYQLFYKASNHFYTFILKALWYFSYSSFTFQFYFLIKFLHVKSIISFIFMSQIYLLTLFLNHFLSFKSLSLSLLNILPKYYLGTIFLWHHFPTLIWNSHFIVSQIQ